MPIERQTLVFDADDTLWENNVLFERVVDAYLDWLAHPTLDRTAIRAVLDEVERANVVVHGYGSASFLRSLADCFERLNRRPTSDAEARAITELAAALVDHRVELVPGVAETLGDLGTRHDMLLLTKGQPDEQQRKIDASDLASHFRSIHIVAEKRASTYHELIGVPGPGPGVDLDDRQLAAVGHPPGAGGRTGRGVHPERQYLGARGGRDRPHRPRRPAPAALPRAPPSFLTEELTVTRASAG